MNMICVGFALVLRVLLTLLCGLRFFVFALKLILFIHKQLKVLNLNVLFFIHMNTFIGDLRVKNFNYFQFSDLSF